MTSVTPESSPTLTEWELAGQTLKDPILWLDCETTGLNPDKHAPFQIAMILDWNQRVLDHAHFQMQPPHGYLKTAQSEALNVTRTSIEDIREFPHENNVRSSILETLEQFENEHASNGLILAGHNIGFDDKFLRRLFEREPFNTMEYGTLFDPVEITLDTKPLARSAADETMERPEGFSLEELMDHVGIEPDEGMPLHDARTDISCTRELFWTIVEDHCNDVVRKELEIQLREQSNHLDLNL